MGAVKEYAFSHHECPICGRCYLPWETGTVNFCGRPECEDEANQLFEEIADKQQEGDQDGQSDERNN
jgi:hypothetical protein